MKDWVVGLLIFIAGLLVAGFGTYVSMEKTAVKSSAEISTLTSKIEELGKFSNSAIKCTFELESLGLRLNMFEQLIMQQNKRLNIAEVRSAKVEEAALAQTRAVETLTEVVSTLAGSQQNIAVALAGMNEKLRNLDERSTSLEGKLDKHMLNSARIRE